MPNSESAIFVGIAAAAIGEFWEPRDGQQDTDPLSWSFFFTGPDSLLLLPVYGVLPT